MGNDKIVEQAHKRFSYVKEYQAEARRVSERCRNYVAGKQWDNDDASRRKETNRPMITVNKLASPVNITANKNAMERARIKVSPFEDTDVEKSQVVNGLIRHIQYSEKSNADIAFAQAFSDVAGAGKGAFRISTEYLNDMSFEQEITIDPIEDPDSVYEDKKGRYTFVTDWMPKDEFESRYPDVNTTSWSEADADNVFLNGDEVCVAEYWVKEETPVTIYKIQFNDIQVPGTSGTGNIDQLLSPQQPVKDILVVTEEQKKELAEGSYTELASRESKTAKVKQYIIGGNQVIEENEWAGKYIPIVVIYGKRHKVDGKVFYKSLIYDAIDPQKMYNFYRSQEAEMLMQQPKAPWIGAEGQFDGHEDEWDRANIDPVSRLEYQPVSLNGQLAPPPQRTMPPQVQAGFVQAVNQASDEIKATTGLFDASLGAQGNERSGKAILARQQQGEMGTYHFTLAFNEALRYTGVIIVDLIPHIYDTERAVRILGEDMREKVVKINSYTTNDSGEQVLYDLTVGSYDVVVETGPALNTRRMDAAENLLQLVQYVPSVGPISADLIVKNMDVEYSDELSNRLWAGIPPQVIERAKQRSSGDKGPSPEQMMIQQLQQTVQQMGQQLQKAQQIMQGMNTENQQLKRTAQNNRIQETEIQAQARIEQEKIKAQGGVQKEIIKARAGQPMLMR